MKSLNPLVRRNSELNLRRIASTQKLDYFLLFLALVMRLAGSAIGGFSYFVLAGYALRGRKQAMQALALSWLFSMLSDGIAPFASASSFGRYAVVLCAAISIFMRKPQVKVVKMENHFSIFTFVFGVFLLVHSILVSPVPDVSILKAILWTIVTMTVLRAWGGMSFQLRIQLERELFGGLVLLGLLSIPLIFSGIGYMRNGTGFQGVLFHPQSFGPAMALLGAFVISRMLAEPKPMWQNIAMSGLCLTYVVLSGARTAGLALVLGVSISIIITLLLSGLSARQVVPGFRSSRLRIFLVFILIVVALNGSMLGDVLNNFMNKNSGDESVNVMNAYEKSRGFLIDAMLDNIDEKPWTGIGFGIASSPSTMYIERDPVLGLPVSATIEKGVLPLAVLEELGALGFVLFIVWLSLCIVCAARGGVAQLSVLLTLILFNFGESTLFSSSGFGLLPLVLIGWSVSGSNNKLRSVRG